MKAPKPLLYVTLDTEVEVVLYVRVENGHLPTVYPVVRVSFMYYHDYMKCYSYNILLTNNT